MAQGISFQEATALAKQGNGDAQYALSSVLHQRGQFDESLRWLRLAAAQKLIPAQITLATVLMDGRQCPRDRQQAIDLLQPLAASQLQANLLLSEMYGFTALGGIDQRTACVFCWARPAWGTLGRCANWPCSASAISVGAWCVRCSTGPRGAAMLPRRMPWRDVTPRGSGARRTWRQPRHESW